MSALPRTADTVHFIGSICLPDQRTATEYICYALSSRLRRISDGETGKRCNFVMFQRDVFNDSPFVKGPFPPGSSSSKAPDILPGPDAPPVKLSPVEYDDYAIAGYFRFCNLRAQGVIPKGVRFQVSLPTPINVLALVEPLWRAIVEPMYEKALLAALRRIQDHIPARDLAIQWDLAQEFAFLEGAASTPAWFTPVKEGILQRVLRLTDAVDDGVAMGFHLCYRDLGHRHFVEPRDTALLVEVGNAILKGAKRSVDWIHLPVPKSRVDAAYFAPLEQLELADAELYLGLLHADDEDGTRERIKAATEFVRIFGLATECGLGRSSLAELDSILEIAERVTGP